jgi:hypothetical protein
MPGKTLLSEDYIIRMINTVLTALTRIMGLKTTGQYQEAETLINQTLEELFGMRADLLKRLDDHTLFASLTVQNRPDSARMLVAGRLFQEEGEILAKQGNTQGAFWSFVRALSFSLEASFNGEAGNAALSETIANLVEALDGHDLPADTEYSLFCYYEETGRYQQADNALKVLERNPQEKEEVQKERSAFYNRLLAKNDVELFNGGVSRLQVVQALNTVLLHTHKVS